MFKTREQLVSDTLKTIDDSAKKNNRIVFVNDDSKAENRNIRKKQRFLFEDDENDEEVDETLEFKINKGRADEKLSKLQVNIGNDKRFALDYRFMDEDNTAKNNKSEEVDLQVERKWQLGILQNVLGKSVNVQNENDDSGSKGKKKMIRYDPTEDNHQKYEVTIVQVHPFNEVGKVKQTFDVINVNDLPKVVSKNIFYTMSDNLVNRLQKEGEEAKGAEKKFSLLKTFGKKISRVNDVPCRSRLCGEKKLQSTIDANLFNYDSSDNENPISENFENSCDSDKKKMINDSSSLLNQHDDSFFFNIDDSRFYDAKQFFRKHSIPQEKFQSLRCELKQIVRMKIRKNLRKSVGCNKKRRL